MVGFSVKVDLADFVDGLKVGVKERRQGGLQDFVLNNWKTGDAIF